MYELLRVGLSAPKLSALANSGGWMNHPLDTSQGISLVLKAA